MPSRMSGSLSPDTDRRFVETAIARGVIDARTAALAADEHRKMLGSGTAEGSLAQLLCTRGLLDRRVAAELLRVVRAERSKDSTWPRPLDATPLESVGGATFGDYALESELGRGAMGVVYRARHAPTGALRALKVIPSSSDVEWIVRFRREAEALARVAGEGVVPVHEAGVARGRVFFVMGLMPGGSLDARLAGRGRFAWEEAVRIAVELGRALERCHAIGIIHRDLKPANVLFDEQDRPRLGDFGLARDLGAASLTETGAALGTPAYMAPEQLRGEPADARADIHALAAILHELISGERPHAGGTVAEVYKSKRAGRRTPLATVPGGVEAAIARALAPDPARRQASMAELVRDLEAALAGGEARGSRPLVLALAFAGVLVAAVALALRPSSTVRPGDPAAVDSAATTAAAGSSGAPVDPSVAGRRREARTLLARVAAVISSGGSVSVASGDVKRAVALGSLPEDEVATVASAAIVRIASAVAAANQDTVTRAYEEILALRDILRALGVRAAIDPGAGLVAKAHANRIRARPDPDWDAVLVAGDLMVDANPQQAGLVGNWCVDYLKRQGGPPGPFRDLLERAIAGAPPSRRQEVLRWKVDFMVLAGDLDEALRAATGVFERLPDEVARDRESEASTVVAIWRLRTANLRPDLVAALVAVAKDPLLLLVSARSSSDRRMDALRALESKDLEERFRPDAYHILSRPECIKQAVTTLLYEGRNSEAANVLAAARKAPYSTFAPAARAASTPEKRVALAKEIEALKP